MTHPFFVFMDLLGRAKQLKEVSATPTGANLHGSGGLLSMPGLGKRKKKKKVTTKHLSESHNQATHAHSNTAELVTSLLRMPAKAREAAINALPPAHKKAVEDEMSKRHSMATTTKPGDKYRSIKNPAQYEALRRQGYSKSSAAAISNAGGGKKKKTTKEHTSVMTAFMLPSGLAGQLALSPDRLPPNSSVVPVNELHLTLAYIGDMQQQAVTKEQVLDTVKRFAGGQWPIKGKLNGTGCFQNVDEGSNTCALYASFDAPKLPEFRQNLMRWLVDSGGVTPAMNHGFIPHITLAYIPIGAALPYIQLPQDDIIFDSVTVAWGDERHTFRLGTEVNKSIKNSFAVFKQKDGRYRWVSVSSNAYRDRDGEIVSTKALQDDCERADREKDYGPLRFWHMPGVDIGDCDFNAVHSKSLLESGTFRDEPLAEKIARKANEYQLSIGFRHKTDQPDKQGVFHNIRRFERSLVPAGKAANPFTSLIVHKESNNMNEEKRKALLTLFDGDEEAVKALVSRATESEKQADSMGIAFKSKDDLSSLTADQLLEYAIAKKEAEVKAKEAEEDEEEEFDFKGYMKGCMTEMKNMVEGYTTEVKKLFGERNTKKEDTTASIKEATDAHSQRIATLETTLKQLQEQHTTAVKELTALKENAPAGIVNGVRPTQQADNVVAEKEAQPVNGYMESLKGWADFATKPYGQ